MGPNPGELVIDDTTDSDLLFDPFIDGERKARGCVPRDYSVQPREFFEPPGEIVLIPRSEWSARIKEKEDQKSRLSDLRLTGNNGQIIPSLNQGSVGYCWAHSTTHAVIITRAKANQLYVPLSAYAVAATIKSGRDEGGWCGLSADFIRKRGVPSQAKWPQGDRQYTKYQNDQSVWDDATSYKTTEEWQDLNRQPWDRRLTFDQLISLLLSNEACPIDLMWWGHSVLALDAVEVERGSYGARIWNSWGDEWSDRGMGILREEKATPDDALCVRVARAA